MYSCGLYIETTSHYFLHCPLFHTEQSTLLNNINEIDSTILNKNESVVTCFLQYGGKPFKDELNLLILNAAIDFVLSTNRFDESLYLLPNWRLLFLLFMIIWLQFYNFIFIRKKTSLISSLGWSHSVHDTVLVIKASYF